MAEPHCKREKPFQAHAGAVDTAAVPPSREPAGLYPLIQGGGEYPEPASTLRIRPCGFYYCLFEEFGDEWCNKLMFFQRWFCQVDAGPPVSVSPVSYWDAWWGGWQNPCWRVFWCVETFPDWCIRCNETNILQLQQSFEELPA